MKIALTPSLLVLAVAAFPLAAQQVAGDVAKAAQTASANLKASVDALQVADGAKDRVAALTRTIKAFEAGLAAMRQAMREAQLRETSLSMQFQTKRAQVSQLLGVLQKIVDIQTA